MHTPCDTFNEDVTLQKRRNRFGQHLVLNEISGVADLGCCLPVGNFCGC